MKKIKVKYINKYKKLYINYKNEKKCKFNIITDFVINSVFLIVIIFVLFGCSVDKNDLKKYSDTGNENELIKFIDKNKHNYKKYDLIKYAINEIVKKDLNNCEEFIENSLIENIKDKELEQDVFIIYNNNNKAFLNWNKILLKYYETNNTILKEQLLKMLNNYDDNEINKFCKFSKDYFIKEIYNLNFFVLRKKLFELKNKLNNLSLLKINENQKNKIQKTNLTIDKYNEIYSNTIIEENEILKIKDEINAINKNLKEDEEYIEENGDYFYLNAYIVGQYEYKIYEIALSDYDYYYGKIPSDKHAILVTIVNEFSSKGWFNLYVRKLSEIPMQIKHEFGGFTQKWDVYQEVPEPMRETVKNKKNNIRKNKILLSRKLKEKDNLEKDFEKKRKKLDTIKEKIISQLYEI